MPWFMVKVERNAAGKLDYVPTNVRVADHGDVYAAECSMG